MDPFTLAFLGATAIKAVSGIWKSGTDANNSIEQSYASLAEADDATRHAALYGLNAELADAGASTLKSQAEGARAGIDVAFARARVVKGRIIQQGRETLATQRTGFAAAGLDTSFGSPLVVQSVTASRVAADLDLADANAAIEAADAEMKAANLEMSAANKRGEVVTALGNQIASLSRANSLRRRAQTQVDNASNIRLGGMLSTAQTVLSGVAGARGTDFSIDISSIFNPTDGMTRGG